VFIPHPKTLEGYETLGYETPYITHIKHTI